MDFFSQPGINELSNYGETNYNTLSDRDISAFFGNRLHDAKAFEKITQVLLRLKDRQGLHNEVLLKLREYSATHDNQLPLSFEASKVRGAYIRLKTINANKNVTFTEKNLEYFLYIFKSLQMWPEIIDLCENYSKLSQL